MSDYVKTEYYKDDKGRIIQRLANDPAWEKTMIEADGSLGHGIYSLEGLLQSVFKLGMKAKERQIRANLGIKP